MINFELNYKQLQPSNLVETIAILVCKQISSHPFKNEITDKLISYISCISIYMYATN